MEHANPPTVVVTGGQVSPLAVMLTGILLSVGFIVFALWMALGRPHLDLPKGAVPISVAQYLLNDTDLAEESDLLGDMKTQTTFYHRQSQLAQALTQSDITVTYRASGGAIVTDTLQPQPSRIGDLTGLFWFQVIVGVSALVIGAWVLALRQREPGAWMFALTGFFLATATVPAAVYSTRQIALPGELFSQLSGLNHIGSAAFGVALVCLWATYPRQLMRPLWLWSLAGGYVVLAGGDIVWRLSYGQIDLVAFSLSTTNLTQMLIAIACGMVQWRRSRAEPLDRAGLRWFLLTSLVGCSLFIGFIAAPAALGLAESLVVPQSYAFGFFLIMHVGMALGLSRYRVFELDRFAYSVWRWLLGAALVIAIDIIVLQILHSQPWASLSIALLLAGFLYFPLRQFLLGRFFSARDIRVGSYLANVVAVSLAPTPQNRESLWDELLKTVFQPADIRPAQALSNGALIEEQGLGLVVPGTSDVAPRRLRYAMQGRRLFSPRDIEIANTLIQMQIVAAENRESFSRGMSVERDRISRDVHDNIGAQLLSALHTAESSRKDDLLRDTLNDLRTVINEGFRRDYGLSEILADLRAEVVERLSDCQIALVWTEDETLSNLTSDPADIEIGYAQATALRSVLRETISNIVKHAQAKTAHVTLALVNGQLDVTVQDDGKGLGTDGRADSSPKTNGLSNIRTRATAVGGTADIQSPDGGVIVRFTLPLTASLAAKEIGA